MCVAPFGGYERLDRIDFTAFASGTTSSTQLLYVKVVAQAASDYLYFGLGKNGTVLEEFWYSAEYFFTCRSHIEETWNRAKFMRQAFVDDESGERVVSHLTLTGDELRLGCFDLHYEIAGLDRVMPLERFVLKLKEQRLAVLATSWDQVLNHLSPGKTLSLDGETQLLRELHMPTQDGLVSAFSMTKAVSA
jgi:hypothetical protein